MAIIEGYTYTNAEMLNGKAHNYGGAGEPGNIALDILGQVRLANTTPSGSFWTQSSSTFSQPQH